MKKDVVSIITPMYNAEKYIAMTIDSVLKQSYVEWEMLIIDDCSTDKSPQIVEEYCTRESRIVYLCTMERKGVAGARNYGIERAKGQYIAFLDSDDLWHYDKLKKQIEYMQQNLVAFCYSDCRVIDENGNICALRREVPAKLDYNDLVKGNEIPCLTVVVDREIVKDIVMPQMSHEDYATWLRITKQGIVAYGIQQSLADYRVYKDSVSGKKGKSALWTWKIYYCDQKMGLIKSSVCFVSYAYRAIRKRKKGKIQ